MLQQELPGFWKVLCIASVADPAYIVDAQDLGADMIELRLDLWDDTDPDRIRHILETCRIPFIATLRSVREGGRFSGSVPEWWEMLSPYVEYVKMVDIEQVYRTLSPCVRSLGKTVIASFHTLSMPSLDELNSIERELRSFGDIPKIVVTPNNPDDVLTLCSFTLHAKKPIVTSLMGEDFTYARALMPLFGSAMTFGYAGIAASAGQYHIKDIKELFRILH